MYKTEQEEAIYKQNAQMSYVIDNEINNIIRKQAITENSIKTTQELLHDVEMKAKTAYYTIYPCDEYLKNMKTKIELFGFTFYSEYKFGCFRKFILKHIFRAKVESFEYKNS